MFTPTLRPPATGLDTFAAAPLPFPGGPGATAPSLASLAQEFVEMAEVSADATSEQVLRRPLPGSPPCCAHISVGGAVFTDGGSHRYPISAQGPRTLRLPGHNCKG